MNVLVRWSIKKGLVLVILLLLLLGQLNTGRAQTFNYETTEGSVIVTGHDLYAHGFFDTITVWCNQWDFIKGTPTWGNTLKMKSNTAFVKFAVDNYNTLTKYQTPIEYRYYLAFKIIGYTDPADTILSYTIDDDTLTIAYNNFDNNAPYQDLNLKRYSGFYKIQVIAEAILMDLSGTPVPANLSDTVLRNFNIEASILTQPYYKTKYGTGASTVGVTSTYHATDHYIDVSWISNSEPSPTNYELEWTYVDDYSVSVASGIETPIPETDLEYNFLHNSTRVWLNSNSYRIPVVYPRGYVVFRVRRVRPDSTSFQYPVYSNWSLPDKNVIGSISAGVDYYHIYEPYMNDKFNWQYTVSFAEGGKYKNVASFYDGLLKNRQSITRFNTNLQKIIATNNIYDYEGRLCIKTLPAPANSTSFDYLHGVDLNAVTNAPYVAADFDTGTGPYATAPPMATDALTNVYYSNNNPDTVGAQKYVPDAGGYPFVQTIYDPGYADRISAQGGAGPKLQPGTPNYMKYDYVTPPASMLASLLGTNFGDISFYTMTVNKDPNEQVSIAVKDYEGKQLISALIGEGPDSATHAINTVFPFSPNYITEDLVANPERQQIDASTGTRVANVDYYSQAHAVDSLQYICNFRPYEACPGQYVYAKGHVTTSVSDEYGNYLYQRDTVLGKNGVDAIGAAVSDTSAMGSYVVNLAPYHIHKSLTFSPWDVNAALDSFFYVANCFRTPPSFIRASVEAETFPCTGSFADIHDSDECSKMQWQMMQQLFPGGAYAGFTTLGDSVVGSGNSVFDMTGCSVDTFVVNQYFTDSNIFHCYHTSATDNKDSMVIVYDHPTLGNYGYRCACTGVSFRDTCVSTTSYTTTVTIVALDLHPNTNSINVPFSATSGGMTGQYSIRGNWNLEALSGNIMLGPSVVGTIAQHTGVHDTTIMNLQVDVSGDVYTASMNATLASGDSFIFAFSGVMSPGHDDTTSYFTDSVLVDSVDVNYWSPLCHYRYRDTCTVPSLRDSIVVNGILYPNMRAMRTDSFIAIYAEAIASGDYSIAEALLPLHPQYCELKNCFVDTFKKQLMTLPDWRVAETMNLFYLDSLAARDPIKALMDPTDFPSPEDSLIKYRGGTMRLDSFTFLTAYCACEDSVMFVQCYQEMFAYEIQHRQLISDGVKERYFKNILNVYLGNRQRFVNAIFEKGGNTCSHCALARMQFDPAAAIPPAHVPIDSILADTTHGWVTGILTDSLQDLYDSTRLAYHADDSLLAFAAIDSMVAKLSNCIQDDATLRGNIRASLTALYHAGEVSMGNFSAAQVRQVLAANGVSFSDLCNPFILNFDGFGWQERTSDCMPAGFYDGLAALLTAPATELILKTETSGAYMLDSSANQAEWDLAKGIGHFENAVITATYNSTLKLYTVNIAYAGVGGSTVNMYLHSPNCGDIFSTLTTGAYTLSVECLNNTPGFYGPGMVNQYGFVVKVTPTGDTTCRMMGWLDMVPTMVTSEGLATGKCIPCTEIRKLYTAFNDSLAVYDVKGADHPYYTTMLGHFMNTRLQQQYTPYEYERFIESCALADSMTIPLYSAYSTWTFASIPDMRAFFTMLNSLSPGITFEESYRERTVGGTPEIRVCINLNTVPERQLWEYKNALSSYSGTSIGHILNEPYDSLMASGAVGYLHCDPAYPFDPRVADFMDTTYVRFVGPYSKEVWIAGSFVLRDFYDIIAQPGTPAWHISRAMYQVPEYLFNSAVAGVEFTPLYRHTVNQDYFKAEKQDYLRYTYDHQQLPGHAVMAAVQPNELRSNIASYAPYSPFYSRQESAGVFSNLYLWDTTMNTAYYDTLRHIVSKADPGGNGYIFSEYRHVSVPYANGALDAYICGDGSYWYRYFTTGDSMFNVYVAFPKYIPKSLRHTYHVVGPVVPLVGDRYNRYFALNVVRAGSTDTLELFGMTSFVTATSKDMQDVLLRRPPHQTGADTFENCERQLLSYTIRRGWERYFHYRDSAKEAISNGFRQYVVSAPEEHLVLGTTSNEQYHTIYNYDRQGNLTLTVPPAGSVTAPAYSKKNTYTYNTLNQVREQRTINGGRTRFMYDAAGRLVFSQNAKQAETGLYTYNRYDGQSRIIETGEVLLGCPYFDAYVSGGLSILPVCSFSYVAGSDVIISPDPEVVYNLQQLPYSYVDSVVSAQVRTDVVMTIYDSAATDLSLKPLQDKQENLRKRVSCVKFFTTLDTADTTLANYGYATHYSYDVAGNVQTLVHDYPLLDLVKQRYKRIDYDYDVISGKVNMLSYNRGLPDQFYHRYGYDADNRITLVQTSNDGMTWKRDAAYTYYDHGPLARTELGDLRVQGMDYAYTIQGWLKSLNCDSLDMKLDMGGDAAAYSIIARDAVAYNIGYFTDDYSSITGRKVQHSVLNNKELFNGNIAGQTVAINNFERLTKEYVYDQYNRIQSTLYYTLSGATRTAVGDYYNAYSYDPDGNLLRLVRVGNDQGSGAHVMDSLIYHYTSNTDKLYDVSDTAADIYGNDIKQHTATGMGRYTYDAIGNTIRDLVSGQDTIQWNLYNKVVHTANNTDTSSMTFAYDGAGNRVSKTYLKGNPTDTTSRIEIYVRDATGNILATYTTNTTLSAGVPTSVSYYLSSHDLYGSSRLGTRTYYPMQIGVAADFVAGTYDTGRLWCHVPWYSLEYQELITPDSLAPWGHTMLQRVFGNHVQGLKRYEVSDHLGNVLATLSDKRAGDAWIPPGYPWGSSAGPFAPAVTPGALAYVDRWKPIITDRYDYYPFGMYMPGRHSSDTSAHCLTSTFTGMLAQTYHQLTSYSALRSAGSLTYYFSGSILFFPFGGYLNMATVGTGRGVGYDIPLISGTVNTLAVTHGSVSGSYVVTVTDVVSGLPVGSTNVTGPLSPGTANVTLAAHSAYLHIDITSLSGSGSIDLGNLDVQRDTMIAQNIVTTVCNTDEYRYGYNGKLKDNEWSGEGNHYDYGFRLYDSRVARFVNVDPLTKKYPWYTPYQFAGNTPIQAIDLDGAEPKYVMLQDRLMEFAEWLTAPRSEIITRQQAEMSEQDIEGHYIDTRGTLMRASRLDYQRNIILGFTKDAGYFGAVFYGFETADNYFYDLRNGKLDNSGKIIGLAEAMFATATVKGGGKSIHGNSKSSSNAQHGYGIFDRTTGEVLEYGVSGQPLRENGTSPRIEQKIRTKYDNSADVSGVILTKEVPGREFILEWEKYMVKDYKQKNGVNPPNQKRPN